MTAPVILPNLLSLTAEALPAAQAVCEDCAHVPARHGQR
jgi:hypothetical protein